MFTERSSNLHKMFTEHTHNTFRISTRPSHNANRTPHTMLTALSQNAHRTPKKHQNIDITFNECSQNHNKTSTECSQKLRTKFKACSQNLTKCSHTLHIMLAEPLQNACSHFSAFSQTNNRKTFIEHLKHVYKTFAKHSQNRHGTIK